MPDKLDEISRIIGNLEGTVKEGFSAVNQRLDKTNDSLGNHEKRINRNESIIDESKGVMKIIGAIGVFFGSLITVAVQYLLKNRG